VLADAPTFIEMAPDETAGLFPEDRDTEPDVPADPALDDSRSTAPLSFKVDEPLEPVMDPPVPNPAKPPIISMLPPLTAPAPPLIVYAPPTPAVDAPAAVEIAPPFD